MSIQLSIKKSFENFTLDVDFEAENDVVGLLGASGCGKSMTLKCIAGVVRPDEGRIVVDGVTLFDSDKKINIAPRKRHLGLLFQNYALFPNMTVKQNVCSVLSLRGKKDLGKRFAVLAEKFYIGGLENHYPAQLSGGQQQRVALARIMASEPAAIMLDEPLSALDSYLCWQLEGELLQAFEEFKGTVLYVSHNRDEIYRLCSKVCVLKYGENEKIRTVKELFDSPDTLASSLLSGCKNYSRVERTGQGLFHAIDWGVHLRSPAKSTEDVHYVGVRAHYIRLSSAANAEEENVFSCRVLRVVPDVFSTIVSMKPLNAASENDFSRLRMELDKGVAGAIRSGQVIFVKILSEDLLLLKK